MVKRDHNTEFQAFVAKQLNKGQNKGADLKVINLEDQDNSLAPCGSLADAFKQKKGEVMQRININKSLSLNRRKEIEERPSMIKKPL